MGGRLSGKKVLITGAAGGLGQAMARMMVREGAILALTDIDGDRVRELADSINAEHPGMAISHAHDVTREDDWVRVSRNAANEMGGISVLVNNAGIGGQLLYAEQDTLENWHRVQAVNLESVMLGCKHTLPHLKAEPLGSIVNISSIAGLAAAPGMGAYNATKAAVWLYTKTVALECAKAGGRVRANSVHPVYIETPILDPFIALAGGEKEVAHKKLASGIPMKRIGEPDDVAYCVVYLASDESKFVTGSEFKIDGGMTAQ